MGAERTKGPWAAVRNDGAYVKDPKFATWRIEERSTPAEMVVALVVSDVKALNAEANAAFIVRAANSHEELVAALKECGAGFIIATGNIADGSVQKASYDDVLKEFNRRQGIAQAALAKAVTP